MTHLNRVVLQVDSQQWGVGGQLGHLCTTQDDISSFRSIILFTSLKSSTLLLLAQNSSKLVMCSTPKHHHEQWTFITQCWQGGHLRGQQSCCWQSQWFEGCCLPNPWGLDAINEMKWNELKWNEMKSNMYTRKNMSGVFFLLHGCETIVCHI